MASGQKLLPQRIDIDRYPALMTPDVARYIKNLIYDLTDTSGATNEQGAAMGAYKPIQSNVRYIENLVLPDKPDDNFPIGKLSSKETREVYVFIHNKNDNHIIYRLNGNNATYDIIYQGFELGFILQPEFFIHEGGATLTIIYLTNPATGEKVRRSFLSFTTGFGDQRQICVEDAISTNGFNATLFPYFSGDYDRKLLINMGVPTPSDCIGITEVPNDNPTENNRLLYDTWQWRLRYYDVWGRPSEYGIMSDIYIPASNDCILTASGLPRCVDLLFDIPPPHINQVEIAYRNCNSQQWNTADVLDLYNGSSIGEWWMRPRNSKVEFIGSKIKYRFCADKKCTPIAPAETNRVSNPQPRTSQSIAKIDSFLGLSNNKDGFLPFSQELKDKIHLKVESSGENISAFRNITIWLEIFNPFFEKNQPIYRQNIDEGGQKANGFGAFYTTEEYRSFFAYKQYFINTDQKGFIGYLAGTKTYAISEQYFLSKNGELTKIEDYLVDNIKTFYDPIPPLSGLNPPPGIIIPQEKAKGTFLQKFEFRNIPKGIYVFRLAAHQSEPDASGNYQKTSTYTSGTYGFNYNDYETPVNHDLLINEAKELIVDVCDENYDSINDNKILVVWDGVVSGGSIYQGYVRNTNDTTKSQHGIELMRVDAGAASFRSHYTDHNGFYFVMSRTNRFRFQIFGYCSCIIKELFNERAGTSNQLWSTDFYANNTLACLDYENKSCNFILIKGKAVLCGTDIGVPNLSVVLSRGNIAVTDADGNFTLIASDDAYNSIGVTNPYNPRIDNLYFITSGCAFDGCDGCITPIQISISKCISCEDREITVNTVGIKYTTGKGLLSGATYPVGVTPWDWLGRAGFIQTLGYLTIPSVQDTKMFSTSVISVEIDADAIFPEDIEYITFSIGEPVGILEYITWIVDKVEFIDNSGDVNDIAPTQIKIYYGSLIEYNKQNNFNTTVNWSFISSDSNEPVLTDRVTFLLNGDGTFFDKSITSLIKYDQEGQYFLINYTSELKDLQQDAIIRLVRPKQCESTDLYYEVCSTVNIVNRRAEKENFTLNAFDTYYINRQIPVPITVGDEIEIQLRVFGVPFEHNSPSDFWGEKCKNIGRVNVENPQETEIYHEEQVALSGALSETGQLNFLNYFDSAKKTDFSDTQINGIVSVLPYPGVLLFIGQSDNFIVGFNDNLIRVNTNGTVQAASIKNAFGEPQTKISGNYGCLFFDKNTISRYENIVQWLDTARSTVVQHNYQQAVQVTKVDTKLGIPGGIDSWIRPKVKSVQQYNLVNDNKRFFHGMINPVNMDYILTDFIIGSNIYFNEERDYNIELPETLVFNTVTKFWKGAFEFIPEMYADLQGELSAQQLFSFKNGIPYKHYSMSNQGYGTIYGKKVNRIFEVVAVLDGMNKKRFNNISQYCKQAQYFADRITTENGQETRILLSNWLQAEYGWHAPFLCDLNTPFSANRPKQTGDLKIMEGDVMYGNFVIIRLVGNPEEDDKYSELQGIIIYASPNSIS